MGMETIVLTLMYKPHAVGRHPTTFRNIIFNAIFNIVPNIKYNSKHWILPNSVKLINEIKFDIADVFVNVSSLRAINGCTIKLCELRFKRGEIFSQLFNQFHYIILKFLFSRKFWKSG